MPLLAGVGTDAGLPPHDLVAARGEAGRGAGLLLADDGGLFGNLLDGRQQVGQVGVGGRATDTRFHDLHVGLEAELGAQGLGLGDQAGEIVTRNRSNLYSEHATAGGDVVDPGFTDVEEGEAGGGLPPIETR